MPLHDCSRLGTQDFIPIVVAGSKAPPGGLYAAGLGAPTYSISPRLRSSLHAADEQAQLERRVVRQRYRGTTPQQAADKAWQRREVIFTEYPIQQA
jgi:hypothetical protein